MTDTRRLLFLRRMTPTIPSKKLAANGSLDAGKKDNRRALLRLSIGLEFSNPTLAPPIVQCPDGPRRELFLRRGEQVVDGGIYLSKSAAGAKKVTAVQLNSKVNPESESRMIVQ